MISAKIKGGLGNNLFQISAAYSLALENKDEAIFDLNYYKQSKYGHISKYTNNIFRNLKFKKIEEKIDYKEPYFHFKEIEYKNNLMLDGYFQSEKYFEKNRIQILELFSIDKISLKTINEKYKGLNFDDCCSLHVRRGDYLLYPSIHPFCGLSYINECLKLVNLNNIIIFSNDIKWCKENIKEKNKNVIFINNNQDYIDLWLMSLCSVNIISNSTFSWWAAWLNKNPNKKVFCPKKWFGDKVKHETKDLYPEGWRVA